MWAAEKNTRPSHDSNSDADKQYRLFLFMTANIFLHEVGHVYITYLTKGRESTPPNTIAYVAGNLHGIQSEAGRNLETRIVGGTLNF